MKEREVAAAKGKKEGIPIKSQGHGGKIPRRCARSIGYQTLVGGPEREKTSRNAQKCSNKYRQAPHPKVILETASLHAAKEIDVVIRADGEPGLST